MTHVSALFHEEAAAHKAVDDLVDAGFPRNRISIVLSEETRRDAVPVHRGRKQHVGEGAAAGGTLGGILGGVAALASLGIPGGIVVAGPLAALLGGLGVGAVSGGLLGALIGAGVPEEHAREYHERVRYGDILVSVEAEDPTRAALAERTLDAAGARTPPRVWPERPTRV